MFGDTLNTYHDAPTLIIGGSAGIGAELARQLMRRGESVIVVGRQRAHFDVMAAPFKAQATFLHAELSLLSSIQPLLEALSQRGPFKRLIFTAGMIARSTWQTAEGHEANLMVNHISRRLIAEALLDLMVKPAQLAYLSAWGDYKKPLKDYAALDQVAGGMRASMNTLLLNDVYFQSLSAQAPSLRITAFNPGPTRGTMLSKREHSPWPLKVLRYIAFPLVASDLEVTAARLLSALDAAPQGLEFFFKAKRLPSPELEALQAHRAQLDELFERVLKG